MNRQSGANLSSDATPDFDETRTLYRRTLPAGSIPFGSSEGRTLFREALVAGTMEGYFALAEQFHTQGDPSFCGLGTLVIVLNALAIDPGRTWKGSWRWFAEDLLDCCRPLEEIRNQGITLAEFVCLARCNGAKAEPFRPSDISLDGFRNTVRDAASLPGEAHVAVAYDRSSLGQTGAGHFSPVGGYHEARDLALLLDVARFKYPPHWVPLERLWSAMQPSDPATGKSRGFVRLSRGATLPTLCNLPVSTEAWTSTAAAVQRAQTPGAPTDLWRQGLTPSALATLSRPKPLPEGAEHQAARAELVAQVRATELFARIAPAVPLPIWPEIATLLVYAAPDELLDTVSPGARAELDRLRATRTLPDRLKAEIASVRAQLHTLTNYCRTG